MAETVNINRWFFLREACKSLGANRHNVMRWVRPHNTPASKVGRLRIFRISDIDERVRNGGASAKREVSPCDN